MVVGLRRLGVIALLLSALLSLSSCGQQCGTGRVIAYSACRVADAGPLVLSQGFSITATASVPVTGCTVAIDADAGVLRLELPPAGACAASTGNSNPMPPLFPVRCEVPPLDGGAWLLGTTPPTAVTATDGGFALADCP